jgi:mRNA-degrading endonuclease RelE of RelBE toxin-antitoxin system
MFGADNYPISVVETRSVQRDLDDIFDQEDLHELIDWLAVNPTAGDVIQGTDGVRKARWGYGRKGKSGGIRLIYYFRDLNMPIYVLAVYKKGEKLDLTQAEKKVIRKMVSKLVDEHARQRTEWVGRAAG